MSGHGFHVHGPHDHEVEHVAQHGGDSFTFAPGCLDSHFIDGWCCLWLYGRPFAECRIAFQERGGYSEDFSIESVELLSGQE